MRKPAYVTLDSHRIRVQRWTRTSLMITFTTVIRGENLGQDVIAATQRDPVTLQIDGEEMVVGRAQVLDQRIAGTGPTAVHRLEIKFVSQSAAEALSAITLDDKLDAIIAELQALRQEVRDLRSHRSAASFSPQAGSTLLDFDIPTEPNIDS